MAKWGTFKWGQAKWAGRPKPKPYHTTHEEALFHRLSIRLSGVVTRDLIVDSIRPNPDFGRSWQHHTHDSFVDSTLLSRISTRISGVVTGDFIITFITPDANIKKKQPLG